MEHGQNNWPVSRRKVRWQSKNKTLKGKRNWNLLDLKMMPSFTEGFAFRQEEKDNLLFNLFFVLLLRKNNDIPKLIPSMCFENDQRESSYTAIIGKKFLNEGTKKQKWSFRDECALEFDSSLPLSPFKERNNDRSMAESESWSIARWDDAWSS